MSDHNWYPLGYSGWYKLLRKLWNPQCKADFEAIQEFESEYGVSVRCPNCDEHIKKLHPNLEGRFIYQCKSSRHKTKQAYQSLQCKKVQNLMDANKELKKQLADLTGDL